VLDSIYAHRAEPFALASVVVRHIRQLAHTGDRFLPFGVRPLRTLSPDKFATFAQLSQDVEAPVTCRDTVVNMLSRFKEAYEAGTLPISALQNVQNVYNEQFLTFAPVEVALARQRERDGWASGRGIQEVEIGGPSAQSTQDEGEAEL